MSTQHQSLREALCEARIAMRVHKMDPAALGAALNRLLLAHGDDVEALAQAGLMAPLANDRRAWRVVAHRLEGRGDPALGWLAWQKFLETRPSARLRADWADLITYSARAGFLPALRAQAEARAPARGILRTLYLAPRRFWFEVLARSYEYHDARDLRLPPSRRRQLG
jgi:hypothetical protein